MLSVLYVVTYFPRQARIEGVSGVKVGTLRVGAPLTVPSLPGGEVPTALLALTLPKLCIA